MLKNRFAFTAIETLLTISIIAVTAGMTIPMYRNYQIRNDLDLVTEQTIQGLRRAQVLAQSGEHDLPWGFYVQDGVLYAGEAYAVRNTEFDEMYPVPSTINASGLPEVNFSRVEGVPDKTGKIVLEALNGDTRIIEISTFGVLDIGNIESPQIGEIESSTGSENTGGDTSSIGNSDQSSSSAGSTASSSSTASQHTSSEGGDGSGEGELEPTCEDMFKVNENGTIETTGTVNAAFTVLGSEITYGSGGPKINVTVEGSINGGETWFDLFNGKNIKNGDFEIVNNLTSGSEIVIRVKGRHSWYFNKEYVSNDESGHIIVLRNGEIPPDVDAYANQTNLKEFIQNILTEDGKINIGEYDAVYLSELGTLGTASADFQDAVILVTFNLVEGSCAIGNVPKFKVEFPRLENEGQGNASEKVFVGEQGIPYSAGQWVPLKNDAGALMVDNFLTEDVNGMAAWREGGRVRFLQHGSLSTGSKEIMDAKITFANATILRVENDVGQNATENPFDGVVNDGAGGDEVTLLSGSQSLLFQTRVTAADDAIFVYWQEGIPQGSTDSDGDGIVDGYEDDDTNTEGGETIGDEEVGGGNTNEELPDPCAVPLTIENGVITINGPSDVTFRALGSYAHYGNRGPEISTFLHASFNGGNSYETLFNYRDIDGGERQTFRDISSGSQLVVKGEGRYSWLFRASAESQNHQNRVRIHRRNDATPGTLPFQNINGLQPFLRNVIDSNKYIDIGKTSLLLLFELQEVGSNSDYQDIVLEIFIEKPSSEGICGGYYDGSIFDIPNETSSASYSSASSSSSVSSIDDYEGEKIIICHFPPGNKQNPETIEIALSAWDAHKKIGDRMGACESDADGDTVPNSRDLCPDTYFPEEVPDTGSLLNKRYALTHKSPIFREGPRKKLISEFSLESTKGCSCSQLIDIAEGKKEYHFGQFPRLYRNMRSLFPFYTIGARNFGCGNAIMNMIKNYDF